MKWMNFTIIEIEGNNRDGVTGVQRVENIPINVEQAFMVAPTMIPSAVAGPNGQPVGTIASRIISSGGAAVVVEGHPTKIVERISGRTTSNNATCFDASFEDKPNIWSDSSHDDSGPKVIKLPVPKSTNNTMNKAPTEE